MAGPQRLPGVLFAGFVDRSRPGAPDAEDQGGRSLTVQCRCGEDQDLVGALHAAVTEIDGPWVRSGTERVARF